MQGRLGCGIEGPAGDQVLHALDVVAGTQAVVDVELIGLLDLVAVDFDFETALFGQADAAAAADLYLRAH